MPLSVSLLGFWIEIRLANFHVCGIMFLLRAVLNILVKTKNENLTAHQRIFKRLYQCQSKIFSTFLSKITKYNRVPLGFDPSVARLLGHDPTPRPTCLV